jgi:type I restriction enzyme, S subunit
MSTSRWKRLSLGDVTSEGTERLGTQTGRYPVYGVDRSIGLTPGPKYVSNNLFRYKQLLPGMFAYNPMRLNIGSIGYCSSHHEPGLVSPDYVVFRCDMKRLDPEFLKYYIQSAKWRDWTEGSGVGSVRVRIYYRELARMPVTLPPVDEQRAIADIMGTLDNKIELNRRMNETLEAMERTLFKSWFVDFDPVRAKAEGRDPGLPKPLADLFPDSFEDSELGEIPKGWTVGTLNDVADHPRRGIRPSEMEPTTPYIALEHMPKRCIALSEWSAADGVESNKFKFKKGEILFGKLRPYFHKVGVAPLDGVCSTDIVVVAPRAEEWFGFVLGHISSDTFVEHTNAGSTGTKMPRTSWSEMARYPMVVPPESVAKAFTFHARPVANHIIASIHESRTLATLRDTLLPKLISGKLRVQNGKLFRVQRS